MKSVLLVGLALCSTGAFAVPAANPVPEHFNWKIKPRSSSHESITLEARSHRPCRKWYCLNSLFAPMDRLPPKLDRDDNIQNDDYSQEDIQSVENGYSQKNDDSVQDGYPRNSKEGQPSKLKPRSLSAENTSLEPRSPRRRCRKWYCFCVFCRNPTPPPPSSHDDPQENDDDSQEKNPQEYERSLEGYHSDEENDFESKKLKPRSLNPRTSPMDSQSPKPCHNRYCFCPWCGHWDSKRSSSPPQPKGRDHNKKKTRNGSGRFIW